MQSEDGGCDIGAGAAVGITYLVSEGAAAFTKIVIVTVARNVAKQTIIAINGNIA